MIVKDKIEQSFNDYHWTFFPDTEKFMRWGKEEKDDPEYSVIGPEHLDIEISSICHGIKGALCKHCYTGNSPDGKNMSLETFKTLFDLVRGNLTTVHFSLGDLEANPNLGNMLRYVTEYDVVPSVTISGERKDDAALYDLVTYCGHIDVSCTQKDLCYNTIARITEIGKSRVNMRLLLSMDTLEDCRNAVYGIKTDVRLRGLNGVKLDWIRSEKYRPLLDGQLSIFLNTLALKRIPFAVSQCMGDKMRGFLDSNFRDMQPYVMETEPCEAGLFTGYISVDGIFYPCPFTETAGVAGISVLDKNDFVKDVWNGEDNKEWREQLLTIKRTCPLYV